MSRTLDLYDIIQPEQMATQISNRYQEWESFRQNWLNEKEEVRNYIFATDTRSTTSGSLPWKNSVHIPKLCQLRDNLHANYIAALFPNDRSIVWEGDDEDSEAKDKRLTIQSYIENKMRLSNFRTTMSQCLLDWIDYGISFAMTTFIAEKTIDPVTGEEIVGYVGPKAERISVLDLVFNPTATSFEESPKILRSIKTLGSLKADMEDHPEMQYLSEVFDKVMAYRGRFGGVSRGDAKKNNAFAIDGFSHWLDYFQSDYVEILDFYGDFYDVDEQKLYKNYLISVVDRCHIIRKVPNPSWLGKTNIFSVGWRLRPDNLYAMGPLDNLVGMQYRIDHLENAKADAFDLIIQPVQKVTGFVEEYVYGPGERIYCGDEGDVEFMQPDTTMLNADTQIQMYEAKMEEMAGAPKQAMGFRTPGEKTAYEVQILENGANRVFLNKTSYFEEAFMEPILNSMLELARRNFSQADTIRVLDNEYGAIIFMKVSKEDITARGKLRPVGARHFARNANILQNLTQLSNSPIGQDPSVNAHISGKAMAHVVEELLDLERYHLVSDNVRVIEQTETAKLVQASQQILQERSMGSKQPGATEGVPSGPSVVQPSPQG